ncbi:MAG: hypothetical protein WCQ77_06000, partial [Planctomycetota bacterium]
SWKTYPTKDSKTASQGCDGKHQRAAAREAKIAGCDVSREEGQVGKLIPRKTARQRRKDAMFRGKRDKLENLSHENRRGPALKTYPTH